MNLDADPYRTLGLTRGASLDDVKRAYRRLAKANHPDVAGAAALPRFLAIRAAYEQLAGSSASAMPGSGTTPTARRRPPAADADAADATRRAYGGRPRGPRAGAGPTGSGTRPGGSGGTGSSGRARAGADRANAGGAGTRRDNRGPAGTPPGGDAGAGRSGRASPGATPRSGGTTQTSPGRGKATLGSTSYDGADAGPFEPDWGGASWYGTTSGTYWTINPKEYADPRKHGPEYQARARRSAAARTGAAAAKPGDAAARDAKSGPSPREASGAAGSPTHTTSSWWESTSGSEAEYDEFATDEQPGDATAEASRTRATSGRTRTAPGRTTRAPYGRAEAEPLASDDLAPDPAQAAIDLGRALTDPRSGGLRGRAVRAALGWLPIALGLGWLVGELTGCGRFAATCDPAVAPLTAAGQALVLVVLLLIPEIAAITSGAALVLLATATAATLILSATGSAADEGSRRAALAALLMVAWLSGLGIAIVRRVRSGPRPARPVS